MHESRNGDRPELVSPPVQLTLFLVPAGVSAALGTVLRDGYGDCRPIKLDERAERLRSIDPLAPTAPRP
jgi:hypothetical protein